MTSQELRLKFINFFKNHSDLPHQEIPSASLIPSSEQQLEGKERVLFTSAGMQPLIPYLTGQKEPPNKRLVNVQKCLRTDDIEQVGDEVHHTFFEMLGNWSIGDYWKEGAIELSFEFLTKELDIPVEKLGITVFAGDEDAPKDEESAEVWKSLGIPEDRIFYFGKSHNWWPTARGEQDSGEYKSLVGPCGPDTEMFYWIGEGEPEGRPNEDSRWVEIWNDVFMQFNRKEDGSLEDLPQRNVDTGMGLERTVAVLNGKDNDYESDLFYDLYQDIKNSAKLQLTPVRDQRIRIFLDHSRAVLFLISEGILPGKNERESVLRRLIRRANDQLGILRLQPVEVWWNKSIQQFKKVYKNSYTFRDDSLDILKEELAKYGEVFSSATIEKIKENITKDEDASKAILTYNLEKYAQPDVPIFMRQHNFGSLPSVAAGTVAFEAKTTLGVPTEETLKIANQKLGQELKPNEFVTTIDILSREHQERSKGIEAGMFKGGLADHSEIVTKYHTATHLLHQALRDVLGPEVFQKGSNITAERLRFDFSFDRKLTEEEIKQVEDLVNKKIEEDLKVDRKIVSPDEAKKLNAIGLFDEKYGTEVSIYGVGPGYRLDPGARDQRSRGGYYSLEFCGGPHVEHTGVIGQIEITKEEAVSSGIRRIRAEIVLR